MVRIRSKFGIPLLISFLLISGILIIELNDALENWVQFSIVSIPSTLVVFSVCVIHRPIRRKPPTIWILLSILACNFVVIFALQNPLEYPGYWVTFGIVALIILFWFILIIISFSIQETVEPNSLADFRRFASNEELDSFITYSVSSIISESEKMKSRSLASLNVVAGIVIVAVLMVLFAGLITNIDISSTSNLSQAESRKREARSLLDDAYEERERINQQIKEMQNTENGSANTVQIGSLVGKFEALADKINSLKKDTEIADQRVRDILTRTLQPEGGVETTSQTTNTLVATAITRFGVIIVLMYFAQALVNLYRYSLRLSAFYQSRAFALVLAKGRRSEFEKYSAVLSADHLTIGKAPSTPIEEIKNIAELTKTIQEK